MKRSKMDFQKTQESLTADQLSKLAKVFLEQMQVYSFSET